MRDLKLNPNNYDIELVADMGDASSGIANISVQLQSGGSIADGAITASDALKMSAWLKKLAAEITKAEQK